MSARDPNQQEAKRRIDQAASILASAIRLGGDPLYAKRAMSSAVALGAEQYAEDTIEDYEGRTA